MRGFNKYGDVVLEVNDEVIKIVMNHLLPTYESAGECSRTINLAGDENFGGGFPREYVVKQVDKHLSIIRDYIIEGLTDCYVEYDENGKEIFIPKSINELIWLIN